MPGIIPQNRQLAQGPDREFAIASSSTARAFASTAAAVGGRVIPMRAHRTSAWPRLGVPRRKIRRSAALVRNNTLGVLILVKKTSGVSSKLPDTHFSKTRLLACSSVRFDSADDHAIARTIARSRE